MTHRQEASVLEAYQAKGAKCFATVLSWATFHNPRPVVVRVASVASRVRGLAETIVVKIIRGTTLGAVLQGV